MYRQMGVCEATEEPPSLHLRRWPGLASQNFAVALPGKFGYMQI